MLRWWELTTLGLAGIILVVAGLALADTVVFAAGVLVLSAFAVLRRLPPR